jgi:hypothetical protein
MIWVLMLGAFVVTGNVAMLPAIALIGAGRASSRSPSCCATASGWPAPD